MAEIEPINSALELQGIDLTLVRDNIPDIIFKAFPGFDFDFLADGIQSTSSIERQSFSFQTSSEIISSLQLIKNDIITISDLTYIYTFKINTNPIYSLTGWGRFFADLIFKAQINYILPVVSITSTGTITEDGSLTGKFIITLDKIAPLGGLEINYILSGDAIEIDDFEPLGTITIPENTIEYEIIIDPVDDTDIELDEILTLSIQPSTNYTLNLSQASADLTLISDDILPPTGFDISTAGGSNIILSNSDKTITSNLSTIPNWQTILSKNSKSSGKYYVEFRFLTGLGITNQCVVGINQGLDIVNGYKNNPTGFGNSPAVGISFHDGRFYRNNSSLSFINVPLNVNDIISAIINLDDFTIQYRLNGTTSVFNTITAGTYFLSASIGNSPGSATVNVGQEPFIYDSVFPLGYSSWDGSQTK